MRITVINGSPKGEKSITYQTVRYWQKRCTEHTFTVIHAAQKIRALEKDLTPALTAMREADLILFAYPVYTFLAPAQLHRFIELVKASGETFEGKPFAQFTTSKHFYDITAHAWLRLNGEDLGMRFTSGLSADMSDLTTPEGRKQARAFLAYLRWCVENGVYEPRTRATETKEAPAPITATVPDCAGKTVCIVTDAPDSALAACIDRFRARFTGQTKVVDIAAFPFRGGCLGCLNCAATGKCVYTDGYSEWLRNEILTADAIVFAFRVQDHCMGTRFKLFDDRRFCDGHRTVTMGSPTGYIATGGIGSEPSLRTMLRARAEVGGNFFCGIAETAEETEVMADRLAYALANGMTRPSNFYGVGGQRIFRDLVYQMRGFMKADHRFFKAHGLYDFPHNQKGSTIGMYLLGAALSNPKLRKKILPKMTEGMLMPYTKAIDAED